MIKVQDEQVIEAVILTLQEWECTSDGTKTTLLRSNVVLTDAQAHVYNTGKTEYPNSLIKLLFLPGSDTYFQLDCNVI